MNVPSQLTHHRPTDSRVRRLNLQLLIVLREVIKVSRRSRGWKSVSGEQNGVYVLAPFPVWSLLLDLQRCDSSNP